LRRDPITVIREESPDKYSVVETVKTAPRQNHGASPKGLNSWVIAYAGRLLKRGRASLDRTAGGGCPHIVVSANGNIAARPLGLVNPRCHGLCWEAVQRWLLGHVSSKDSAP